MTVSLQKAADTVPEFCARIGKDPLLVQGAGGNVSWKEDDVLWVKASGTWLAEADKKDIFVPVDLPHLLQSAAKGDFSATPHVAGESSLRPSIETFLHAIMPHKVVVHVHAVEALAFLVRIDAVENLERLLGDSVKWVSVDYFKPGAELANAVSVQLESHPDADVVFMRSHGVVIGGEDVESIQRTLDLLRSRLKTVTIPHAPETVSPPSVAVDPDPEILAGGFVPSSDPILHELATRTDLSARLQADWALFPDHVVFLGAEAALLRDGFTPSDLEKILADKPPFIFVVGKGVYESATLTPAKKAQLRCYYDVLVRLPRSERLASLSREQIAELLNWDAEKYRKSLESKKDT